MTHHPDLRALLRDSLLVGDGAMSTYLYQQGIPVGMTAEELSLSRPDWIEEVHRQYVEAGARLIETNTYGANRERLSRYSLEGKVSRINRESVAIARRAAEGKAYVAGAVGSINAGRVSRWSPAEYRDLYEEQATALLYGGVDGIILETFFDLEELLLALEVIRPLTDLPILAQLTMLEVGRTRDGHTLTKAFAELQKQGVDGVGLNCRVGPLQMERALEKTVVPDGLILTAFPNAGRLGGSDGEYQYESTPEYFGNRAKVLREQGVHLIGGCCGTTPEHIRKVAEALHGLPPAPRVNPKLPEEEVVALPLEVRSRPTVVEQVRRGTTVIVEFDPPKDLDIQGFLQGAEALHRAGADAITLADNSMATPRMSNMALASILKSRLRVEPLVHITCRDRNLLGQQSHLMGLHALDIDQILVVTGDPTRIGDLPGASSIYDINSFDLIRMVKRLNEGISFSGKPLRQQGRFVVGAAFNPHVSRIEAAIRRLEKKVEAGADFVMTQPVYDVETLQLVHETTRHIPIPIFIGVMPLTGHRNALFLHNELPGVKIPETVMEQMRGLKGPEGRKTGVKLAGELLDEAVSLFNGIYLITPFHYWEMTAELTRSIRKKGKARPIATVERS
ncbi:bifunctional homocysteine S-methyltransferase/5,10-methylenetetrahydrofolate reductase [Kroppenstedtia guangzhouensis]|uniref:Bifunctional homocysteine S-methyltransferase/5,10-methylenetetrahydrofolate reductase n=1 Tax=Kroppenstedtia guangzhouensis TaxID=1274356 RepID=A0ABQ1GPG3_9BACL|nr:bifunctional homocysteine S-methyltransferase/methylenetetrahydrofolate reductase [Kroppenstedtia guangzhouensis]GGA47824.1 bifunctional homocysteine S-methyltransferase/5,10-methylenetetrahydrofolate reductase [Kroppenstedtia guangzhouensis]